MKDREVLQFMGSQRVRHDLATEQQHWRKSVENGSINLVFFFSFLKKDVWFLESGLCIVALSTRGNQTECFLHRPVLIPREDLY